MTNICEVCGGEVIEEEHAQNNLNMHKGFCTRISDYTVFTKKETTLPPEVIRRLEAIILRYKK